QLQGFTKRAPAERSFEFLPTHPFVFAEKPPKPGERQRVEKVGGVEVSLAIALAREGEDGVRSGFDAAVNQAREMNAEKRKLRVRHRINQVAHQVLPLALDFVI